MIIIHNPIGLQKEDIQQGLWILCLALFDHPQGMAEVGGTHNTCTLC